MLNCSKEALGKTHNKVKQRDRETNQGRLSNCFLISVSNLSQTLLPTSPSYKWEVQQQDPTCFSIPHIGKSILTAWEDEASTWGKGTVDPLPVVCGTYVFLYGKTTKYTNL